MLKVDVMPVNLTILSLVELMELTYICAAGTVIDVCVRCTLPSSYDLILEVIFY